MIATTDDAVREYTRNVGRDRQDHAWILSPYDTWERNPFYVGPVVQHPESDEQEAYEEALEREEWHDYVCEHASECDDIPY